MALTLLDFKKIPLLKDVGDDILNAVVAAATAEENAVKDKAIGDQTGKIHGAYDEKLSAAFGIQKPAGKPSSLDFWANQATEIKTKLGSGDATELQKTIDNQTTEIADLKKKIADGATGDGVAQLKVDLETAQIKLKDAESKFSDLQSKYDTDVKDRDDKLAAEIETSKGIRVDHAFNLGLIDHMKKNNASFNPDYDDKVLTVYKSTAKNAVLNGLTADFVENPETKKNDLLVFRDQDGKIQMDPDQNFAKPLSAGALYYKELSPVLKTGKKQPGGGSGDPGGGSGGGGNGEIGSMPITAKTQVEANVQIETFLLESGVKRHEQKFSDETARIIEENKDVYNDLPFQ